MPGIYKNSMGSELYIQPLGSTTLTAGPDTLRTLNLQTFGQLQSIAVVIASAVLAGSTTVIWYGAPNADGTGTLVAIATLTLISTSTTGVLQIDAEDIGEAAEVAGLGVAGFKALVLKIDGANADTIKSTVVAIPMHERVGLTPSAVTALT